MSGYRITINVFEEFPFGHVGELVDALREGLLSAVVPLIVGDDLGHVGGKDWGTASGLGAGATDFKILYNMHTKLFIFAFIKVLYSDWGFPLKFHNFSQISGGV